jgi:hypothetical protein
VVSKRIVLIKQVKLQGRISNLSSHTRRGHNTPQQTIIYFGVVKVSGDLTCFALPGRSNYVSIAYVIVKIGVPVVAIALPRRLLVLVLRLLYLLTNYKSVTTRLQHHVRLSENRTDRQSVSGGGGFSTKNVNASCFKKRQHS